MLRGQSIAATLAHGGRESKEVPASTRPPALDLGGARTETARGLPQPVAHSMAPTRRLKMKQAFLLLALLPAAFPALAVVTPAGPASPLAHTYSIVARDPATGELGV